MDARQRLVEQQEIGLDQELHRQFEQALLADRQILALFVLEMSELEIRKQAVRAGCQSRGRGRARRGRDFPTP